MAIASSSSPAPVAADVAITSPPVRSRHSSTAALTASGGSRSLFERQSSRGSSARPCPCSRSSASTVRVVLDRVGAVERLQVEHVQEQAAALDVSEELVAEPRALAGALDQARDVRQHELALTGIERAQHRMNGGERILRPPWALRA